MHLLYKRHNIHKSPYKSTNHHIHKSYKSTKKKITRYTSHTKKNIKKNIPNVILELQILNASREVHDRLVHGLLVCVFVFRKLTVTIS